MSLMAYYCEIDHVPQKWPQLVSDLLTYFQFGILNRVQNSRPRQKFREENMPILAQETG